MDAQEQLRKLVEEQQLKHVSHQTKTEHKGHSVSSTQKDALGQMVRLNGKKDTFYIWTLTGMAEKWKKDKSINLLDVVQSFQIMKGGAKGQQGLKPSMGELETEFGTNNMEQACRKLLELGEVLEPCEREYPEGHITQKQDTHYATYKDVK